MARNRPTHPLRIRTRNHHIVHPVERREWTGVRRTDLPWSSNCFLSFRGTRIKADLPMGHPYLKISQVPSYSPLAMVGSRAPPVGPCNSSAT